VLSPAGEEGAVDGLPPPPPEAGGLDLGGGAQSLDQLFEGSFYGIEERRIQRVARKHEPAMEPISEDWAAVDPGYVQDDRAFDPPELGQSLPSDPDQLLQAYTNLAQGGRYEGQPGNHPDYVGAGYRCFDMGKKADFLVRQDREGEGLLDFSDVVMFQKEVGVYCRPAFSGAKCEGPASYYTFPWVQWFPGDPLEGKPEESEMTKMIFVERQGGGAGPEDGPVQLNLDRCFVLDGENTMVLSMGPSDEAELSRHGKRGTAQTACHVRDVRAYDEGAAPASPTTMRVNFSKLRLKPSAEEELEGGGPLGARSQEFGLRIRQGGISVERWCLMPPGADVSDRHMHEAWARRKAGTNTFIMDSEIALSEQSPFSQTGAFNSAETEWKWQRSGLDELDRRGEIPEEFEPVLEPNFYETVDPESKSRWFTHLEQESSALDSKMDFSRNLPKDTGQGKWSFEGGRWVRSRTLPPEQQTKLQ